jgi:hypothetical protein
LVVTQPSAGGRLTFAFTVLDVADERFTELSLIPYVPDETTATRNTMQEL